MISLLSNIFRRKIPSAVTHIIWDVDGTLYRNTDEIFRGMVEMTITYVQKFKGKSLKISEYIREQVNQKRLLGDIVETDFKLDKYELARTVDLKMDKSKFVKRNSALVDLFNNELGKFKHSILTNGSRRSTEKILNNLGFFENPFDPVITADLLGKDIKPSEKGFKNILNYHKIGPGSVLMIGDALPQDIYPAKKIGMYTCFLTSANKNKYDKADFVIGDVTEIISLL